MKIILTSLLIIAVCIAEAQPVGTKRGLSNVNTTTAEMSATQGKIHWWYNWSSTPEGPVSNDYTSYGYEFVPMVWGGQFGQSAVSNDIRSDAKFLLGFNEPNFMSQANMTAQEAADLWPQLEAIAAEHNLELVSPATNWCGDCVSGYGNDPLDWLDDFFAKCVGCKVDYVALHWYSCTGGALQSEVDRYKKYGLPIWVTEFACWDIPSDNMTVEDQQNYLVQSVDLLENDPDVFRYSWFAPVTPTDYPYLALFSGSGSEPLTDLGRMYNKMPVHDENYYYDAPLRLEAENYSNSEGILLEITEDEIGFVNVGWMDGGDWLEYKVNVPKTKEYTIWFRTAAPSSSGSFDFLVDSALVQNVSVNSSGGWQTWQTSSITTNLTAGQHTIRMNIIADGFNFNWMVLDDGSLSNSLGIENRMIQENVKLYPSCINRGENIVVEMPKSMIGNTHVDLKIMNNLGQLKFEESVPIDNSGSFLLPKKSTSQLASGSYIIHINANQYQGMGRFVVK